MANEGKVIESTGKWYQVAVNSDPEELVPCRLPGRFRLKDFDRTNPVAVGDHVSFTITEEDGTGWIEEIKERKNYITRAATHGQGSRQIIASNIDQAVVIQSVRKPRLKQGFIDRFLVTCEACEIPPRIVINKMDLATDEDEETVEELQQIYEEVGYETLRSSIHDKASIETVEEWLEEQTSVFIGPSGVGKSSILNQIDPSLDLKVAPVSSYNEKGRHTTTFARLHVLSNGGFIIDTPGIREFGLDQIEPDQLSQFFPEMIEPAAACKFNDCSHTHEPDCGVKKAYERGEISRKRYNSYLRIREALLEQG